MTDFAGINCYETVSALRQANVDDFAIGRAILTDLGAPPPVGHKDDSKAKIAAFREEIVAQMGSCPLSVPQIARRRNLAHRFTPEIVAALPENIAWSAIDSAGSPERLAIIRDRLPVGAPLLRDAIRNMARELKAVERADRRGAKIAAAETAEREANAVLATAKIEHDLSGLREKELARAKKAHAKAIKKLNTARAPVPPRKPRKKAAEAPIEAVASTFDLSAAAEHITELAGDLLDLVEDMADDTAEREELAKKWRSASAAVEAIGAALLANEDDTFKNEDAA